VGRGAERVCFSRASRSSPASSRCEGIFERRDEARSWGYLRTNAIIYGTTQQGGSGINGTVFSLSAELHPFVETLTTSGIVGAKVTILGNSLTGATSGSFNGTAATFKVVSATEITSTVPAGATTGLVTVATSQATLTSNLEATAVTRGGVKATSLLLESDEEVVATVPTGAKTGHIAITTAGGTATSSGVFTVTQ
jgi:hypothetical protein